MSTRRTATPPGAPGGLRRAAAAGLLQTGGQTLVVRLLSLLTFVVLARLLTRNDYGVAASAEVFVLALTTFAAGGVSQALVQKPDLDPLDVDSLFWGSVVVGLLLTGVMFSCAAPAAVLVGIPELADVLRVMSPVCFVLSVGGTQAGLLQRQFRFALLARVAVVTNLLATGTGIAVAAAGGGYWAITTQALMVPVLTAAALWRASDYRPRRRFSWRRLRTMLGLSLPFLGSRLLQAAGNQGDKLVVARVYDAATLGTYSVAYRLVNVLLDVVSRSAQLVALPAFSRVQDQRVRLAGAYISALRLCCTVALPCFVLAAGAAPDLVHLLFGERWSSAAPVMQVFSVFGALQTVLLYNATALQATGHGGRALRLALWATVVQLASLPVLAPHGIAWLAASFVLRASVELALTASAVHRLRLSPRTRGCIVRAVGPPLLSSFVALAAVLVVASEQQLSLPVRVLLEGAVGAAAYGAGLALLGRPHLRDLRDLAGSVRGREQGLDQHVHAS